MKTKKIKKKKLPESTRRILDLLCGWLSFAEGYSKRNKKIHQENDVISDLYQEAGAFKTDQEVLVFLKEKVIPLVLKGLPKKKCNQ